MKFTANIDSNEHFYNVAEGYYRAVEVYDTYVSKVSASKYYEDVEYVNAFEDFSCIEDAEDCNQREIDLYRKFGNKTSCLCPVDLDNSHCEKVFMKKVDEIGGVPTSTDCWYSVSSTRKNQYRYPKIRPVELPSPAVKKMRKTIKSDFFKLVKRAGIKKFDVHTMAPILKIYSGKYEPRGRRSKLDYDKFTLDLLRIYKSDSNISSDLHNRNIGKLGNRIVITDFGGSFEEY